MPKKVSAPKKAVLSREFHRRLPNFEELKKEALFALEKHLNKSEIKIHSITSRVKEFGKFLEKIERKQYENPFEDNKDFVGVRVICLFLSDIPKIEKSIRKCFSVVEADDKIEISDVASFGYMSVHFIAKFDDDHKGERYENIVNLPFEIQVRTIAMDAWANVSHYLDYKKEQDIPSEFERDFHALSGMFYVADKHFEMFFKERKETQQELARIFKNVSPQDLPNEPINLDTLTAYLHAKFSKRRHGEVKAISDLVEDLLKSDFQTIGDISKFVEDNLEAFLSYESDRLSTIGDFLDVGVVSTIARFTNDKFGYNRYLRFRLKDHDLIIAQVNKDKEMFEEYKARTKKMK